MRSLRTQTAMRSQLILNLAKANRAQFASVAWSHQPVALRRLRPLRPLSNPPNPTPGTPARQPKFTRRRRLPCLLRPCLREPASLRSATPVPPAQPDPPRRKPTHRVAVVVAADAVAGGAAVAVDPTRRARLLALAIATARKVDRHRVETEMHPSRPSLPITSPCNSMTSSCQSGGGSTAMESPSADTGCAFMSRTRRRT